MEWDVCRAAMLALLEEYEIILCPVDPFPAQPHGFTQEPDFDAVGFTSYTKPFSMAGWPSVAVRAGGTAEGLPIGVQVVAGPWREDAALAVAAFIETQVCGWQPPPL
jgi:amidase